MKEAEKYCSLSCFEMDLYCTVVVFHVSKTVQWIKLNHMIASKPTPSRMSVSRGIGSMTVNATIKGYNNSCYILF